MRDTNNILLIVGSAPCVQEDIPVALSLCHASRLTDDEINFMAIGLDAVGLFTMPIQYLATYHPAEIKEAKQRRVDAHLNTDYKVISHLQYGDLVDMVIPLVGAPSGSSSLLGVHAGIQLGYERIIVAGCPLTGLNAQKHSYEVFRAGWTAKLAEIKDKTRSMSGWTKELLGEPTPAWLGEKITIPAAEVIQNHDELPLETRKDGM